MAKNPKPKARGYGGLDDWFRKENWVNVQTGGPCGRPSAKKGKKPACRPAAVAAKLTKNQKSAAAKKKRAGAQNVKWPVTASGRRRKPKK
ncbi:hypothetical protein [Limnobacter sp.]|uniref:hypothetical protein n=1 Tax=Limnobacter sp. TaxID=2003368 RepID=UPI0025B7E336|nr:hypothetical protein [Limnobacter sp.]